MFCRSRHLSRTLVALAAALLFLPACGSGPDRLPAHVVFVPFDYLGPDQAFAWMGRAVSAIAASQTQAVTAATVREAQSSRVRYLIEGYVSGAAGSLRATATVRDENDQRTLRTVNAQGRNALEVASALAKQVADQPKPYTSANPEAVHALFSGKPEVALELDRKFGAAYVAQIEALSRAGRIDEARQLVAAARSANLSDRDRANLEVLAAENPKQRAQALLAAARASGYDLALWRTAADAAQATKDHAGAIEALNKVTELDGGSVAIWNALAYTQAFAGDVEGAKRSLAEYQKLDPRAANAYDSMGEIYFYEGRFREAEQQFLRAFEMDNNLLGGGSLYRAALAAFLSGDRIKADGHLQRYLAHRKQLNDALLDLREAVWLYSTRRAEAAKQKAASSAMPAAKAQLALWNAVEGQGAAAFGVRPEFTGWKLLSERKYAEAAEYWRQIYESNSVVNTNEARVSLAWALRGAGRDAESRALLSKWPLPPPEAEPGFSSVVISKAMELKAAGS